MIKLERILPCFRAGLRNDFLQDKIQSNISELTNANEASLEISSTHDECGIHNHHKNGRKCNHCKSSTKVDT